MPSPSLAVNPAVAPLAADALAALRDKVRGMFAYTPTALSGHFIGALIVQFMYARTAPSGLRLGWGLLFAAVWIARAVLAWRFARHEPDTSADYHAWLRWWNLLTLLSGALWGVAAWFFYGYGEAAQQIALVLIVYSYCVACVPILSPQLAVFTGFISLLFLPAVARVGIEGSTLSLELAGVMLLAFGMTVTLGRTYRASFNNVVELKQRTERLMEQLRAEKAVSDAARQEAEVANRAKTQFFAAASHDLRQPLHAVSLFAEALRQRSQDEQVIELVNSINASVDALEGLFSELLDITRIDTGGVDVKPVHFALTEIYRKLRLHFEPTAFEKGLSLRFRGEQHAVFADPLLVERVLRNLVSNAIRYTADGTVLVSCRRRGERLRLQVWDTGLGIGPQEQAHIFEEFYQVQGTTALAPSQKKGLGLGLAIVKRLADLMHAPLALQSSLGRGSVFTLELPLGKAPAAPSVVVPSKAPLGLTLNGKLIVVVEDEPAVRSGLEVLLKGWGAQVAAFDTVAASAAWARQCDPLLGAPHLLIVDYRLESGHTGVEAIRSLRECFGKGVPAIMVTGSTMTGHDAEAERDDFHLLIKPVVPNKLRAMIGFKLGLR